jgi:LuxR family transcriptional regulator
MAVRERGISVVDILPLLMRIAAADRAEKVWELAVAHFRLFGFARANYGFTRFRSARTFGDPEDALFLTSCDAAFVAHYFRDNFYARTPIFQWCAQNTGACTWSWVRAAVAAGRLTADELATLRQNAVMGVTSGISISFPDDSTRAKGALGLIADPGMDDAAVERIWAAHRPEIEVVAQMMHLKLIQFPVASRRRALTQRQREVLEWVADGKSSQDVAVILGVSAAMVEKHLRLAREGLQVDTTAQAVAKATLLNLIFHREPGPAATDPSVATRGAVAAR